MRTATVDIESAARELAGNWRDFDSFAWHDRPDDCDDFAIVYTNGRDSDVLSESNAHAISEALEPYTDGDDPDVYSEHHNHWACGWIDGFSIRVYRNGKITDAFRAYCELQARLEDYPILDEDDYYAREAEAIDESWSNWAGSDFTKALEEKFEGVDFNWPDDDTLRVFFNEKADEANEYWEADGSGYSIRVGHIVGGIELDDLEDWIVWYEVSYIDCGMVCESFSDETEAIERVDTLRAAGFIGASYTAVQNDTE